MDYKRRRKNRWSYGKRLSRAQKLYRRRYDRNLLPRRSRCSYGNPFASFKQRFPSGRTRRIYIPGVYKRKSRFNKGRGSAGNHRQPHRRIAKPRCRPSCRKSFWRNRRDKKTDYRHACIHWSRNRIPGRWRNNRGFVWYAELKAGRAAAWSAGKYLAGRKTLSGRSARRAVRPH